ISSPNAGPSRRLHKAQVVTFRSVEEVSRLCLLHPRVPCGRRKKASALLQRASMPAQAAHCLSRAHPRFVPGVEDSLQIWAQSRNSMDHFTPGKRSRSAFFLEKNEWGFRELPKSPRLPKSPKFKTKTFGNTRGTEETEERQVIAYTGDLM